MVKETPESCGKHIALDEEYMWRRTDASKWLKLKMVEFPWNDTCGSKPGQFPDAMNWAICMECSIKQGLMW